MNFHQLFRYFVLYGVVLGLALFGFGELTHGNPFLGIPLLVVGGLLALTFTIRWKFRATQQAVLILMEALPQQGFRVAFSPERKLLKQLLKETIVDDDVRLSVTRAWIRVNEDIATFWASCTTSGESTAAVLCVAILIESPDLLEVARTELGYALDSTTHSGNTVELFRNHKRRPFGPESLLRYQLLDNRIILIHEPALATDFCLGEPARTEVLLATIAAIDDFVETLHLR